MTNKEKFIADCAMRNMNAQFSQFYDHVCDTEDTAKHCYEAACKLANLIFKE